MALDDKTKNVLSYVLRIGISGLLLWYLFSKIDLANMKEALVNADVKFIALALLVFLGTQMILLLRWAVFIRCLGIQVKGSSITKYFFAGLFFNLFLPSSTGGDVYKAWGLCRETDQKAKVVATVVIDRLTGFFSIVLVAVVAFAAGYRMIQDTKLLVAIAILALIPGTILFVMFDEPVYSFFCRVFSPFPKIKDKLMQLHYDFVLLKDQKPAIAKAVGLSVLSQIVLAFIFYLTALGLNTQIPFVYFLIFIPLICVVSSLPSIGGLGFREAGAAFLFAKIGVSNAIAVSMTLINYAFMVIVGLIGGVIYVVALSPRRVQHPPEDAPVVAEKT